MELLFVGSVNQHAKGLARRTQWDLKKRSGDLASHKKPLRDYVTFTKASDLLPDREERDDKLSAIVTKAEAGKKLSQDDWDYLREKSPQLYAKLKEIEREAESYEKALKRCKSRDEALRLHVSKLGEIMAAAKNNDSGALLRLNRMTQTMTAFTESEEYHDLPTEAEQAIERERERNARQEALLEELGLKKAEKEIEEPSDMEDESVSEAEDDAEAESAPEPAPDANAKPEDASHAADLPRAAPRTEAQAPPRQPEPARRDAAKRSVAAPAVSLGHRAYLAQQSGESRDRPRRKAIDAEA